VISRRSADPDRQQVGKGVDDDDAWVPRWRAVQTLARDCFSHELGIAFLSRNVVFDGVSARSFLFLKTVYRPCDLDPNMS